MAAAGTSASPISSPVVQQQQQVQPIQQNTTTVVSSPVAAPVAATTATTTTTSVAQQILNKSPNLVVRNQAGQPIKQIIQKQVVQKVSVFFCRLIVEV